MKEKRNEKKRCRDHRPFGEGVEGREVRGAGRDTFFFILLAIPSSSHQSLSSSQPCLLPPVSWRRGDWDASWSSSQLQ